MKERQRRGRRKNRKPKEKTKNKKNKRKENTIIKRDKCEDEERFLKNNIKK